jgi:hypothetical protein
MGSKFRYPQPYKLCIYMCFNRCGDVIEIDMQFIYFEDPSCQYLTPDPALLPRVGFVTDEMEPGFLSPPSLTLVGPIDDLQPYTYAYNNPEFDTDPTGEGIIGCVICMYYLVKCADAIDDCRKKAPPCDPEKGTGMGKGLGGVGAENLYACADENPCIEKMLRRCISCGFMSSGQAR